MPGFWYYPYSGLSEGGDVMSNSDWMLDDGGRESQKFWQLIISWTYMDALLLHVPSLFGVGEFKISLYFEL